MPRSDEEGRRAEAPMLQAALAYAANGWQVFPAPRGKKKSHKAARYSNGQNWGATTDPDQIKRDWKKWPDANIGLPTGAASGFFVVEADTVEGHGVDGIANLKELEDRHGPLSPTRMAISPSGSVHRYYRYPDGTVIRNSESDLASGVDVRGEGGMVIAPPSVRPGEGEYRWLNDLPIAEAPQWLLDRLIESATKPESGSQPDGLHAAALRNLAAWVPDLFGEAAVLKSGSYRISSKALGRDLEEDLSISPKGIKDFGIHDQGDPREGRRTPVDLVMEYRGLDRAAAIAWLRDRLGEPEGVSLDDFHAYMPQHVYIFAPTGEPWPPSSVNARLGPVPLVDANGEPVVDIDGRTLKPKINKTTGLPKQRMMPPSTWLDQHKPVEQMTWAPGEPPVIRDRLIADGGWIERPGVACFNLYRPPTIKRGDPHQAQRWIDVTLRVYPETGQHLINYFAFKVQNPGVKINHGVLMIGEPGIGKDTIIEPVKYAVGHWNFKEVSPQALLATFNPFVRSVILRINEVFDLGGDINRYQLYEHLKVYTAAPPDVLTCNEKHLRQFSVMNCCGVVLTSNHKLDGMYLPANDRRTYVACSSLTKDDFAENFWSSHWSWYHGGGFGHVAAYLAELDISEFDPKAPPPKTPAFWDIVDASRAPEDAELADIIDKLEKPMALTLDDLAITAIDGFPDFYKWLNDRKNSRAIKYRLEQCDYEAMRNPDATDGLWRIDKKRQVVYVRRRRLEGEETLENGAPPLLTERERLEAATERARRA